MFPESIFIQLLSVHNSVNLYRTQILNLEKKSNDDETKRWIADIMMRVAISRNFHESR